MEKFYFTFGDTLFQPFSGGWIIVVAPCKKQAINIFNWFYPNRTGTVRCADIYSEEQFLQTNMSLRGNRGAFLHKIINIYGEEKNAVTV